ncbi:MAG: hypothetical protein LKE46_08230 [Clostridium sp.]|jgi:hypothetical protein|uniref:hypothetical protein n=1 Tax=Clostridium sp. TaxID=1506 RepID=UPI0025C23507|nr:hypothetical protein [Clostridium sp.]MCH3964253.1 hypothetical protein [Clostridium sp.]MCI1715433.1 hypothetical protein [Clostridium sp.]MCI1799776.1 hypothetical protein [Clostridium sp.]MCI1813616.1 hypothetical protein [Clostridium sp.]MCI1870593.1 hypothetical protein [Clostridium sp.]
MKKRVFLTVTALIFILSGFTVFAASESGNSQVKFDNKVVSDVNKVWTVKFNGNVDFNTVKDNISVKDLSGSTLKVDIFPGSASNLVSILPPSGGYKMNHTYRISVNEDLGSSSGKLLNKNITMDFKVSDNPDDFPPEDGDEDPDDGNDKTYKIHAEVEVSPVLSVFKNITIDSTTVPSGTKFKLEGLNKVYDIKDKALLIADGDTVEAYILDDNYNVLDTFVLPVKESSPDGGIDIESN